MTDFVLDTMRSARIGFGEAVFCAGKSPEQIDAIVARAVSDGNSMLLTRLAPDRAGLLTTLPRLDYDPVSQTAFLGETAAAGEGRVAIVTAGTSDVPVAREAERTLLFNGIAPAVMADIGVAGLWRLMARLDELRTFPVVIVAAGMDAALPSVLGGLLPGVIVAVPTSVGYGVAAGGRAALDAILASCAPGIAVTNIDNGYGAACIALRVLRPTR